MSCMHPCQGSDVWKIFKPLQICLSMYIRNGEKFLKFLKFCWSSGTLLIATIQCTEVVRTSEQSQVSPNARGKWLHETLKIDFCFPNSVWCQVVCNFRRDKVSSTAVSSAHRLPGISLTTKRAERAQQLSMWSSSSGEGATFKMAAGRGEWGCWQRGQRHCGGRLERCWARGAGKYWTTELSIPHHTSAGTGGHSIPCDHNEQQNPMNAGSKGCEEEEMNVFQW